MKKAYINSFLAAAVLVSASAFADTYTWKGYSSKTDPFSDWNDVNNWEVDGVAATRIPGASDTIADHQTIRADLGGKEYEVGTWNIDNGWDRYGMALTNGTLRIVTKMSIHGDNGSEQKDTFLLYDRATLEIGPRCEFIPGINDGAARNVYVYSGATFKILGNLKLYKLKIHNKPGATTIIAPASFGVYTGTQVCEFINEGGDMIFPLGMDLKSGFYDNRGGITIRQESGTLTIGAAFNKNAKNGTYNLELNGGNLVVTNDVSFNIDSVVVKSGLNLAVDITADSSLDLNGVTFGDGSSITKSGPGVLALTGAEPSVIVQDGPVGIFHAGSIDLSNVTFSDDAEILLASNGIEISAVPEGNFSFACDESVVASGAPLVTCDDVAFLETIAASLNDGALRENEAIVSGNVLQLQKVSEYTIKKPGVWNWNDDQAWVAGSVPPADASEAVITGAGVNAVISEAIPAVNRILVTSGAKLTITADIMPPTITITDGCELEITSGAVVSLPTNFVAVATSPTVIPKLTITEGSTLYILPEYHKLKNVDIRMDESIIRSREEGQVYLGYADAGETTYFGLTAKNNSKIYSIGQGGTYSKGTINFACASADSGSVVVPNDIVFKNCGQVFLGASDGGVVNLSAPDKLTNRDGFIVGKNNTSAPEFKFVLDNSKMYFRAASEIRGNTQVVLTNNAVIAKLSASSGDWVSGSFNDNATAEVNDGCVLGNIHSDGNFGFYGNSSLTIREGGKFIVAKTKTSSDSSAVLSGGELANEFQRNSNEWINYESANNSPSGLATMWNVELASGTTSKIRCTSNGSSAKKFFVGAKFSGEGNLEVVNDYPDKSYTAIMNTAGSTVTGEIYADCSVLFANNADWPGTVVANGKIGLTTIASTASATFNNDIPATVSFGGIRFEGGNFPIRVWGVEGERYLLADNINIGANGFSGNDGGIELQFQGEMDAVSGNMVKIGTIDPAFTGDLPKVATRGWLLNTKMVDDVIELWAVYCKGTVIIFR